MCLDILVDIPSMLCIGHPCSCCGYGYGDSTVSIAFAGIQRMLCTEHDLVTRFRKGIFFFVVCVCVFLLGFGKTMCFVAGLLAK